MEAPVVTVTPATLELASLLDVDPTLIGCEPGRSVRYHWPKYLAALKAIQDHNTMVDNGTWVGEPVTQRKIVEIFVSNSFFASHYRKIFPRVNQFAEL